MNDTKWVSMWGNAMSIAEHHPEGYAKDLTLRYPVYAPFSGSALRFTLDNYCGKEPVTIHRATVAVCDSDLTGKVPLSCPLTAGTIRDITFDGAVPSHWQRVHPPRATHSPFRYLPSNALRQPVFWTATLPCSPPC